MAAKWLAPVKRSSNTTMRLGVGLIKAGSIVQFAALEAGEIFFSRDWVFVTWSTNSLASATPETETPRVLISRGSCRESALTRDGGTGTNVEVRQSGGIV